LHRQCVIDVHGSHVVGGIESKPVTDSPMFRYVLSVRPSFGCVIHHINVYVCMCVIVGSGSDTLLHDMLEKAADQGDVQTCVALIIVLKGRLTVDEARARLWFQSYIGIFCHHSARHLLGYICCSILCRLITTKTIVLTYG
jgi:hypothetical protein